MRLAAQAPRSRRRGAAANALPKCCVCPSATGVPEFRILRPLPDRAVSAEARAALHGRNRSRRARDRLPAHGRSRCSRARRGTPARRSCTSSHTSADEELRNEPLIRELIDADPDAAFYTCDVRGIGDSEPQTTQRERSRRIQHGLFLCVARAHAGLSVRRPADLRRAPRARLAERLGLRKIHLAAKGYGALPATFAALLSPHVVQVTLKNALELVRRDRRIEGLQLAAVGAAARRAGQLRPAGLLSRTEEEERAGARTMGRKPYVVTHAAALFLAMLATGAHPTAVRQASPSAFYSARQIGSVVELNDNRSQHERVDSSDSRESCCRDESEGT